MAQVLLIKQNNRTYGISIDQIEAVTMMMTIFPLNGAPNFIQGAVNYHGALIPLLEFSERLGLYEQSIDYSNIPRTCKIVIIGQGKGRFGLILGHTLGLHDIDQKNPVESPLNGDIVHPCLGAMYYVEKELVQLVDIAYILSEEDKHYLTNIESLDSLSNKDELDE
jgi:chemotaxis signal transduction protein